MTTQSPHRFAINAAGSAGVALCVAAGYMLIVRPMISAGREHELQILHAESLNAEAAAYDLARSQWTRKHEESEAERKRIAVQLEPVDKQNEHLQAITSLAESLNLTLSHVDPGQPTLLRNKVKVTFGFRGRGKFTDVAAFLKILHERFEDCRVTGLQFDGLAGSAHTDFSMTLDWFALPIPRPGTRAERADSAASRVSAVSDPPSP